MFRETSPVPYCMAHTGAQLSGSGAQLSGSGAQLSGSGAQLSESGAQLSAISAYLHRSYLGAQLSASPLRQYDARWAVFGKFPLHSYTIHVNSIYLTLRVREAFRTISVLASILH